MPQRPPAKICSSPSPSPSMLVRITVLLACAHLAASCGIPGGAGGVQTAPASQNPAVTRGASQGVTLSVAEPAPSESQMPSLATFEPDSLPPGEYFFASSYNLATSLASQRPSYSLCVLSADGHELVRLVDGIGAEARYSLGGLLVMDPEPTASPDWGYEYWVYPLDGGATARLPGLYSTDSYAVDPPGESIVISTKEASERGLEIERIVIASGERVRLTDCGRLNGDASCYSPSWSPNGRWIKFNIGFGDQTGDPRSGGYMMDTACLAEPSTCMDDLRGPLGLGEHAEWSPDSTLLAFNMGNRITVFDLERDWAEDAVVLEDADVISFAWSPDSRSLAYTLSDDDGSSVHVVDINSGNSMQAFHWGNDVHLLGWISIP